MIELIHMLREAFDAGSNWATEYEHGSKGYYPDFPKWCEQNQKEIMELYHLIKIIDNYKKKW